MKADGVSLGQLMARAQEGDGEAYRAVLSACQQWLRRFFAHRIQPSAIDDLVQEVLVSVHAKRATYDPAGPFLPWLAAIARYRWVDHLRRDYRSAEQEGEDAALADSGGEDAVMASISLGRLLGRLPDPQHLVIRLVKIEGLTINEAAAQSGQSPALVKVNIHRGLKRLASLVESE